MQDNLHEEMMEWIEADEQVALDIIFKHELETTEAKDLGSWFRNELKRREIGNA